MKLIKKGIKRWGDFSLPVKASFFFVICGFLQKGISIITTPIFTRLLSATEYGQYNVFISWMGILSIFTTLQLYYGVYMRGLVKYDDRDGFSTSMQGLTTFIWGCCFIIYFCFRDFWNHLFQQSTMLMIAMFVMIWETASFNFWSARQRVDYKYKLLVAVTLFVSFAKPIMGIACILLFPDDKVEARILSLTVVECIAYSGFFVVQLQRDYHIFNKQYWKYALNFNIPLIPHYLSQVVLSQCDRIMIERMVSSAAAGIYSLAYGLSQIMLIFNTAILNSLNPWIYNSIKEEKFENIGNVSYGILIIIATLNLLLIFFAPECVYIFAPKEYYDAIYAIPPVAMSVYFIFMYSLFADFEFYYEKTKFITIASVMGAGINILLNYLLIPKFGFIAAGYTTLICYILYSGAHYIFMRYICWKFLSERKIYNIRIILLISFVFVGIGFLIIPLYSFPLLRYTFLIMILLTLFFRRDGLIKLVKIVWKE